MAKTLVVLLEDGSGEIRTPNVLGVREQDGFVIGYGEDGTETVRYSGVKTWALETQTAAEMTWQQPVTPPRRS